MSQMNFRIIIPFYNEEKTIVSIAKKLKHSIYDYILINDGSTDNSVKELRKNKVIYYGYKCNKGKGYAIKYAICYPLLNYDYYLIMDGDGQHAINDIPYFLKMAEKYPDVGIFIGNRLYNRSKMPLIRYITNIFMSWVISFIIKQKVDTQCGFRLIRKDVFDLDIKSNRFEFETEILIKAYKKGFKIKNVPIHTIYNKGRKSKINPIKDGIRFIKLLWRYYGKRI